MTAIALLLPDSGASALATNPITDEVQVRVVGGEPGVSITFPENGAVFVNPNQFFRFDFTNVSTTTAKIKYTDINGDVYTYIVDTLDPDYDPAAGNSPKYPLDLSGEGYGYGEYQITVGGVGFDGIIAEDTVTFSFYPVYGEVSDPNNSGNYNVKVYYDENSENLDTIEINVYGPDGELVAALSPQRLKAPESEAELPFAELGLPSGEYTVRISALDADGNELYIPYGISISYTKKEDLVPAPDTGRLFGGANISGADVAVTGLVVLVVVSAIAIAMILKNKTDEKTTK